jgi:hypothetical protein
MLEVGRGGEEIPREPTSVLRSTHVAGAVHLGLHLYVAALLDDGDLHHPHVFARRSSRAAVEEKEEPAELLLQAGATFPLLARREGVEPPTF